MLGLTLAALFEYFDKKLRSEEDIRAVLNLPVLAAVPLVEEVAHVRRRDACWLLSGATAAVLMGVAAIAAWNYLR